MKFNEISDLLRGIPHITGPDAEILYNFIINSEIESILELGFDHGVSTCYMAAALQEKGRGRIITMDLESARDVKPSILELLEKTGLNQFVEPVFAASSYTWELMKLIEKQTDNNVCMPMFDFCFIDGAHTWETDGLAFFLSDKLLRAGGWMLFDDLDWSFSASPGLKDTELVRNMPEDEKNTPQIARVFSLLVAQHGGYRNLRINDNWGWAQKVAGDESQAYGELALLDNIYSARSIKTDLVRILRKIKRRVVR